MVHAQNSLPVYPVAMSSRWVLPDLLGPGLDLVLCGMAAGSRSASAGKYYADARNRFWRILEETGLTSRRLAPEEFASLAEFKIGLTDLAKFTSGADSGLSRTDLDILGFREKMLMMRPRVLAFNGKKAAKAALEQRSVKFGCQNDRISETIVYVLPSTSGAANRYWDPGHWHACAQLVATLRKM